MGERVLMRWISVVMITLLTIALPSYTTAQKPQDKTPSQAPALSIGKPSSKLSFSKELLLIWAYRLHRYPIPNALGQIAASPEAQRPISEASLKLEFKKYLRDNRFQAGWNGIYPGTSNRTDIVNLMGLPDHTETRDSSTRWLYRNRKGARTVVFEFFSGKEGSQALAGDSGQLASGGTEQAISVDRNPQITHSIRIIPKEVTSASQVRQQIGPPENVSFSSDAVLRWNYLRGILVEFKGDQQEVDRIIIRVNDVLRTE